MPFVKMRADNSPEMSTLGTRVADKMIVDVCCTEVLCKVESCTAHKAGFLGL